MSWLLNIAYLALLLVLSPWLAYQSWRTGKYRKGWGQKFWGAVPDLPPARHRVWFHAVSVGEVNLLKPLLQGIAHVRPDWECVISTTTDTGFALAKSKYPDSTVFYCPLDFTWAIRRALRNIKPQMLVLTELELWPNLIREANKAGVPLAVVNARLSEDSYRGYRRLGWLMRSVLRRVDAIACQNEEYAQRFRDLGVPQKRVMTTGSIKFDNARTNRQNKQTSELRKLAGIDASETVFLAGSTQSPEEALALETYRSLCNTHPDLRLILVPRHPERFDEVARLLSASGLPWLRRSKLMHGSESQHAKAIDRQARDDSLRRKPIILVDTVGELGGWWGMTQIAYVGGSMGTRGGQNMIEPAAYGAAVSFGPKTKNFRDVVRMLLAADSARVVCDQEELTAFVAWCLQHPAEAEAMGGRARELVLSQQGATQQTVDVLLQLAANQDQQTRRAA